MAGAGGKSATITIAPIVETDGVGFAAVGLVNMINTGGAVLSSQVHSTRYAINIPS